MLPIHKFYGVKKPIYGHVCLTNYDRNEKGEEAYTYHCECGQTWEEPSPKRHWHCGAINCPHLPRRLKQKFFSKPVGRPRALSSAAQVLGLDHEMEGSERPDRARRVTFALMPEERIRFEETCQVLRTTMSRELRALVVDWCDRNNKTVYERTAKFGTTPKQLMTAEQLEEIEEKKRLHEQRFAVYSKPVSLDEFFAVGQDRWRPKKRDGTEW